MDSIRIVLVVAASKQWEVHHMDVKSAFIHGDLKQEIYVIVDFTTLGRSRIYGLPCPFADSLDPPFSNYTFMIH